MRKIKKINGYLVVKFNDRELREWADTALGNYGVIDAELYTGCLDVDRSVMEYDGAETLEEAIEQARGLESELEVDEPSATYTVIKETDDATEEDTVEPQLMIAGWKSQLETQVKSRHYSDIDPRTAAHELYGFMVALERLGLIEEEDCFVKPDAFKPQPGADFVHSPDGAPTRKTFELGLELMAECPPNDCMLYRNIFEMCLDLDEQIDRVTGLARRTLEAELYKHQHELFKMWMKNYAVEEYRRKRRAKKTEPPVEEATPNMKGLQKLIEELEDYNNETDRPKAKELKMVYLHGVKIQGEWYRSPELGALIGQQVFVKSQSGAMIAETISGVEIGELTLCRE